VTSATRRSRPTTTDPFDQAGEHDGQQIALLGQLADPRLDSPVIRFIRAGKHTELAGDSIGGGVS